MLYDKEVLQKIRDKLINKNKTIAAAESVTAGNVQIALSQAKDASLFYQGGITVYNLGQKYKHLSVEPIHALSCLCVSSKVAEEMAINVCRLFASNYGIGITGFASKQPEKGLNELYAFIAIAEQGNILLSERINAEEGESHLIQQFYTEQILQRLASLS